MGKKAFESLFTTKQLKAAELLANVDYKMTRTEIIEKVGVSRKQFYVWLKDEKFVSYIATLIEKYTDASLSTVWNALIEKCASGDVSAIKLFFEMKGKYKQKIELSGNVTFVDDVNE